MNFQGYDAVIVGTGFGGSACAYVLAHAGLKVLLLERGDWAKRDATDWNPRKVLIDKCYQGASPLLVKQYKDRDFCDVVENEVVGGMSVFYGGASLRLREQDFDAWPISYQDLAPYYDQTEQLLEVHGETGVDPCEPPRQRDYPYAPIALSPPAQRIWSAGTKLGHQPFRIPMAINFSNDKRTVCIKCLTCDGFPCQIEAKNDLTMTLLKSAQNLGAKILTGVQAVSVVQQNGRARSIACIDRRTQQTFAVPAPVIVIAAGAIQSPAILLRSNLKEFPHSDLIGRFLMRHCNAVVSGLFPFRTNPQGVFHKQICFSDFYNDFRNEDKRAVGVIQDIYTPSRDVLKYYAPVGFKNAAACSASLLQNLLCIAEDEPQHANRITLSDAKDACGVSRVQVKHQYTARDCERRNYLIKKSKKILRKAGAVYFHTHLIDSFSHGVGSIRMGHDPQKSVLDANCQFRGISNLFVADGSVFPTSGGVNPSLTIAANALRVAQYIVKAN